MAEGRAEFYFRGLDEFQDDIKKVLIQYPDETSKEVFKLAGEVTKDTNAEMPTNPKYDTIPNSWKRKRVYGGSGGAYTVAVEISNKAPHWHLVEIGHKMVLHDGSSPKNGHDYVKGRKYMDKVVPAWEEKFPDKMELYIDKMLKRNNL